VASRIPEYEFMQSILEIAKWDKAKARQMLGTMHTAAMQKGDPLFARKINIWLELI
jgi:hypothetical protein